MAYLGNRPGEAVPLTCYVGSPLTPPATPRLQPTTPSTPKQTASPFAGISAKMDEAGAAMDKHVMSRLESVFGVQPKISYWPLLSLVIVWFIFAIVIFIIFASAGKTGWGFYYLVQILFMALVLGVISWLMCQNGYSTVAWVIMGISTAVAIGFIIWAAIAFPQIKKLGRSPFG